MRVLKSFFVIIVTSHSDIRVISRATLKPYMRVLKSSFVVIVTSRSDGKVIARATFELYMRVLKMLKSSTVIIVTSHSHERVISRVTLKLYTRVLKSFLVFNVKSSLKRIVIYTAHHDCTSGAKILPGVGLTSESHL